MSEEEITPDENSELLKIVKELYPLQVQLVGPAMITNIIKGVEYRPLRDGRNVSLTEAIAIVSCAAQVAQIALLAWKTFDPRKNQAVADSTVETRKQQTRKSVHTYLEQHPEINQILTNVPQLLDRLLKLLQNGVV